MFPALRPNGLARWLAVVLALFGLAALGCLAVALSAGRTRGATSATARASARDLAPAPDAERLLPVEAGEPAGTRREPALALDAEHAARARGAAETLARAFESPAFEEAAWRAAVGDQAGMLGAEALPALEALLADETRSPEEHVAASELVDALRAE